jgi:hypothetical protein
VAERVIGKGKTMTINFSLARPNEESNGLEPLHDALMKPHAEPVVAVVVIHRTKRVFGDSDSDDADYPVVRFSAVEPVFEGDREAALELLERAKAARSGKQALDLPAVEGAEEPVAAPKRSRKKGADE